MPERMQVIYVSGFHELDNIDKYLRSIPDEVTRATTLIVVCILDTVGNAAPHVRELVEKHDKLLGFQYGSMKFLFVSLVPAESGSLRHEGISYNGAKIGKSAHDLELVRQEALRALVDDPSGSAVVAPSNYHFETPTGMHCTAYVKLADAFCSIEAVNRFAFWLAPSLAGRDRVYLDTCQLLPPIYAAERAYAFRIDHVECLSGYPLHGPHGDYHLNRLVNRMSAQSIFLISVCGSGRLHRRIRKLRSDAHTLHICSFSDSPIRQTESLCTLDQAAEYRRISECKACKDKGQDDQVYRLHPFTYAITRGDYKPLGFVREELNTELFDLAEKYGFPDGLVTLHRKNPHDKRHHPVYIDVNTLLSKPLFHAQLRREVEGLLEGQLKRVPVFCPAHPVAERLAGLIADSLPERISNVTAVGTDLSVYEELVKSPTLLFVDDVFLTGSQVEKHLMHLRELDYKGEVLICVAVARSTSKREIDSLINDIDVRPRTFASVEGLSLPDSRRCPWCSELELLGDLPIRSEQVQNRIAQLARKHDGLATTAFVENVSFRRGYLLNAESPAPSGHLQSLGIAAVDGVLQRWRKQHHLGESYPKQVVMSASLTWYMREAALQGAVLRMAKAHEWNPRLTDGSLNAFRRNLAANSWLRYEARLAIVHRRLRLQVISQISDVLSEHDEDWHAFVWRPDRQ